MKNQGWRNKNITNINNNTIIFGIKSKRIKKELIKKKQNMKNFNKISVNKNDNLFNLVINNSQNNSINLNKNF